MGREISAPAHSHCREHSYCIAVDDALGCKFRNESKCGTDCAEGSDREGHELRSMESEQPFEYEVYLRCQPRQEPCSLIGGSGEYHGLIAGGICNCASPEGDHHHESGDHEYARNDGQTDLNT